MNRQDIISVRKQFTKKLTLPSGFGTDEKNLRQSLIRWLIGTYEPTLRELFIETIGKKYYDEGLSTGIIAKVLCEKYIRGKTGFEVREEEKNVLDDFQVEDEELSFELTGIHVPREMVDHVISFLYHDMWFLTNLGLLNYTWYIFVLTNWRGWVNISSKSDNLKTSLVILRNARKLRFGHIKKGDRNFILGYIAKHVDPTKIESFDFGHLSKQDFISFMIQFIKFQPDLCRRLFAKGLFAPYKKSENDNSKKSPDAPSTTEKKLRKKRKKKKKKSKKPTSNDRPTILRFQYLFPNLRTILRIPKYAHVALCSLSSISNTTQDRESYMRLYNFFPRLRMISLIFDPSRGKCFLWGKSQLVRTLEMNIPNTNAPDAVSQMREFFGSGAGICEDLEELNIVDRRKVVCNEWGSILEHSEMVCENLKVLRIWNKYMGPETVPGHMVGNVAYMYFVNWGLEEHKRACIADVCRKGSSMVPKNNLMKSLTILCLPALNFEECCNVLKLITFAGCRKMKKLEVHYGCGPHLYLSHENAEKFGKLAKIAFEDTMERVSHLHLELNLVKHRQVYVYKFEWRPDLIIRIWKNRSTGNGMMVFLKGVASYEVKLGKEEERAKMDLHAPVFREVMRRMKSFGKVYGFEMFRKFVVKDVKEEIVAKFEEREYQRKVKLEKEGEKEEDKEWKEEMKRKKMKEIEKATVELESIVRKIREIPEDVSDLVEYSVGSNSSRWRL